MAQTDEELARRRLKMLEATLPTDDAHGSIRAKLAQCCQELGDNEEACRWYLEAARHAEWSELALVPLTWAKRAVRVNANSLVARREYIRQWERAGMSGEPPPASDPD